MAWKIVNAVLLGGFDDHVHFKDDRDLPIHCKTTLRSGRVHVFVGDDDMEKCPLYATVDNNGIHIVRAERFTANWVRILGSVLASLGCPEGEIRRKIGWMTGIVHASGPDADGFYRGKRERETIPESEIAPWPRCLDDRTLLYDLSSAKIRRAASVRIDALEAEAIARQLYVRALDGHISNCALACGRTVEECGICFGGPCPDGHVFLRHARKEGE